MVLWLLAREWLIFINFTAIKQNKCLRLQDELSSRKAADVL